MTGTGAQKQFSGAGNIGNEEEPSDVFQGNNGTGSPAPERASCMP